MTYIEDLGARKYDKETNIYSSEFHKVKTTAKENDWNLSSKIRQIDSEASDWDVGIKDSLVVPAEDVKEAVRLLKNHIETIKGGNWTAIKNHLLKDINKIFGDKLT